MAKIITISDVSIKEFTVDSFADGWRLTVLYEWVDDSGKKVSQKRIILFPPGSGPTPEMPAGAQTKLVDFIAALGNYAKQADGIV